MSQNNSGFPQIHQELDFQDNNNIIGQNQEQGGFDNIMSNKFQEILQIQERKVKQLDKKLMEKEQELMVQQHKFNELENDFNFNLKVIEQRDTDISDLVDKMKQLKQIMEEKQDQIQKLQYNQENQQEKLQQLKEEKHDQQQVLYDKIEEMKQEIKFFKQTLNDNNTKHQQTVNELQNKIKQKEQDINQIQNSSNDELQQKMIQIQKQFDLEKNNFEILIKDLKENKQKLEQDHEKQSERLLVENEKLYKQLNMEKQNVLDKEKLHSEEILGLKQQINEKVFNNQNIEKELENLKNANKNWEGIMKEKLDNAISEKQRVQDEYTSYKMKHKQKLKELKDTGEQRFEELIQENHDKQRKLENQIRDLQLELSHKEMIERNLKEKMQERDQKYRKDVDDLEKKYKQVIANLEEDKRTLKNDQEIKEYHLKQLNEDKIETQKKFEDNNQQMQKRIDQLSELEKENKLLIEEVVRYRRDGNQHQPKQLQPILEEKLRQSQKQKESQMYQQKNSQLDKRQKSSPKGNSKKFVFDANLPNNNNIDDDIFGDDDSNEVVSQNYEKVFSEDQGPVSPLRSMQKDLNSIKFSGLYDQNQNPLQNNALKQNTSPNRNLSSKSIQMLRKLKELEVDNNNYKILISNMTKEIETIQNQTQFDKQELNLTKEENLHLRNRLSEFQYDMMNYREKILKYEQEKVSFVNMEPQQLGQIKGQLESKENELQTMKQKVNKQKSEIEKLKRERETLIDISNNLKSKIQEYEDSEQGIQDNNYDSSKYDKLQSQNEIAYERIQELEGEIKKFRIDLKKWQQLDEEKQVMIEQLKLQNNTQKRLNPDQKGSQPLSVLAYNQHQKRREMTKSPPQKQKKSVNKLPKYDNFMDIDDFHKNRLNQFQQELQGLQKQAEFNSNNQNIQLHSQQKPLIQKGENDPRDNSAQYTKISDRNTEGQKQVDNRLKKNQNLRKNSPQDRNSPKPQGKNYNKLRQGYAKQNQEEQQQNYIDEQENMDNNVLNSQENQMYEQNSNNDYQLEYKNLNNNNNYQDLI